MKRLILLIVVCLVAWQGYDRYQHNRAVAAANRAAEAEAVATPPAAARVLPTTVAAERPPSSPYQCDGRTHCSQMKSCAEATYFLQNCPGVQMDGNDDGIPCERQWCKW